MQTTFPLSLSSKNILKINKLDVDVNVFTFGFGRNVTKFVNCINWSSKMMNSF